MLSEEQTVPLSVMESILRMQPETLEKSMITTPAKVEILAICAAVAVMTGVLAVVW